jgi:probable addiction module antidote protein
VTGKALAAVCATSDGSGYRVYYAQDGKRLSCCFVAVSSALRRRTSRRLMRTGKTTKPAPPNAPFRAAEHVRYDAEIALYIEEMLADGDAHAVPVALRTVADALGGMSALAEKTGLSRETLYRTLSDKGNPRLDTLAAILAAFGLRLSVRPAGKGRTRQAVARSAHA